MKTHLNTLFVTLEGAYLRRDGAAVEIRHDGETKLRVPLHNLDGIACFGWDCAASAALMAGCAEANVSLSFHTPHGKFIAAAQSFTSGNVLLRRSQYRHADDPSASAAIGRNLVAAKIANCRTVLLRGARDHGDKAPEKASALISAADRLAQRLRALNQAADLDEIRGIEGDAAVFYFDAFNALLTDQNAPMILSGRSRRPPLDPVNALLSFCYTLLMHDCRSALESAGLDSQCGFLHRDRPGRPSLALDLMEEFRPAIADRAVLTLINRRQIGPGDFETKESGAVLLKEKSRKTVLQLWQERKQTEIVHPFLQEKTTLGLVPHLQARLLCRHLRGDLDAYPAFLAR
jgi:CRISP-associated protein Cas1